LWYIQDVGLADSHKFRTKNLGRVSSRSVRREVCTWDGHRGAVPSGLNTDYGNSHSRAYPASQKPLVVAGGAKKILASWNIQRSGSIECLKKIFGGGLAINSLN